MLFPAVRHSLFVAIPALAAVLVVSCGGSDTSNVEGGPGSGSSTGKGGSINIGTAGNGTLPTGSGGGVTTITKDQACADSSAAADAIPAVVEMVVDTSGSMNWAPGTEEDPPAGEMSKWDITSVALKDAVAKLPASVALGINFYPNTRSENPCLVNRVALGIDLLGAANSTQRRNFNRAIDGANPQGGTPTHGAFLFGSETVSASMVEGQKFVLLITDGVPTRTLDCSGDGKTAVDSAPLIKAVADSFAPGGVKTFVIGSPGSEDARGDLSQMATAGGTATPGCTDSGPKYCHLDMTTAADFATALADGLAAIAGQIGTCEYAVPPPPNGKTINPGQVNVLYTKGDGTESSIGQDSTGTCASGWVYDDAQNPTKITLCGADCDAVKADQGAKIDLIFGCDTEITVPVK